MPSWLGILFYFVGISKMWDLATKYAIKWQQKCVQRDCADEQMGFRWFGSA